MGPAARWQSIAQALKLDYPIFVQSHRSAYSSSRVTVAQELARPSSLRWRL
jgi:hypothetical protein